MGPKAWSFVVEIPISAPSPTSPPSLTRVEERARLVVGAELDPLRGERARHGREEAFGGTAVDEEALGRVADSGAARLRVDGDPDGVLLGGGGVEEDVADALPVLHDRDLG